MSKDEGKIDLPLELPDETRRLWLFYSLLMQLAERSAKANEIHISDGEQNVEHDDNTIADESVDCSQNDNTKNESQ